MGQHVLAGNPPVEIVLRRSARARRISLRVSGLDGRVTLTLPHGVPEAEALGFAAEKADWIRAQVGRRGPLVPVTLDVSVPIEGIMRRIVEAPARRIVLGEDTVAVPGGDAVRLAAWLKGRARDQLAAASDRYAAQLARPYARLTLRDTRSRWGSCSSRGGLMYSWRLIMAPPEVLDYVAAHEVAHLAQMNHSPAFWAEVRQLCPGYEAPRRWLRENGADLHRYQFE